MGRNKKPLGAALAGVLLGSVSITALGASGAYAQQATQPTRAYNTEAQPMSSALAEYARQSDVQVLYAYDQLRDVRAPAVVGQFTGDEALRRLLAQSGWSATVERGNVVRLVQSPRPQHRGADDQRIEGEPIRVDQRAPDTAQTSPDPEDEEIVVTGTRLHGDSPSPVTTITREDIRQSGAATVTQLMRTLPQNFGGGPNEGTRAGEGANNLLEGSTVNLRGLGASFSTTNFLHTKHRHSFFDFDFRRSR